MSKINKCDYTEEIQFERLEVLLMRVKITLACTDCKQRNYSNMKNKKNDPDRLELKKYCKFCHKHTVHKETK
jgi:ribosomal protein L33, bacterial type